MVAPHVKSIGHARVFGPVTQHMIEPIAKEGVARGGNAILNCRWRCMSMTAGPPTQWWIASITGERRLGCDDSLLKENKPLRGFECGTRRISSRYCPIEQRPIRIPFELQVVASEHFSGE